MSFFAAMGAVAAIGAGAMMALFFLVMLAAGAANSTPKQLRQLRGMAIIAAVVGTACLAGGIYFFIHGNAAWASMVGGAPAALCILFLAITLAKR